MLRVRGLGARVPSAVLLDGVDLDLEPGRVLAVVGDSGAGKSTLAAALLGEAAAGVELCGEVTVAGTDLGPTDPEPVRRARRAGRIGLLPQHPGTALDPVRRVGRVLDELAALVHTGRDERRAAVDSALRTAGLGPEHARRFPHQLSGGQQQRAALALTLVTGPSVLVLDEPTTGLDPLTTAGVVANLAGLAAHGTAMVLLTHDLDTARALADDALVLERGRVVRRGPADDVLGPAPGPAPDPAPGDDRTPRLVATGLRVVTSAGTAILDGVDVRAAAGDVHAVIGPSGAGKTTLARALAGLVTPGAGTVVVDGVGLPPALDRRSAARRKAVQYVHQDARSSFLARRPVLEQVARPGVLLRGLPPGRARGEGSELLERLGVDAGTAARRPSGLSGGQLQRAALARAMLADPAVLVGDEVTSALDAGHRRELLAALDALRRDRGTTLVLISHDLSLVGSVADEVTVLGGGRVADHGRAGQVLGRLRAATAGPPVAATGRAPSA
ncbi:ABC transporter ATP-binding protein [Pseudonocardia sp. KRD-291]|nr:ABC transporter ATP-binding protein [Pseudonocardia sp. KRD291]